MPPKTIKLTIKTLDSQNHVLDDVDEEKSVKEFKERIAGTVGIEANLQRLIYCGRVLNDDNKLKEYKLDGKVVHLVQRPPPTGGPDRLAASEARARSRGASPGPRIGRQHIQITHGPGVQFTHDGAAAAGGNQMSVGQPSALVRLNLARSMINRAINVLDDIENVPQDQRANRQQTNAGGEGNATQATATANISVVASGIPMDQAFPGGGAGGTSAIPGLPAGLANIIQSAVTSAISGPGNANGSVLSFQIGPDGQMTNMQSSGSRQTTPTHGPRQVSSAGAAPEAPTSSAEGTSGTTSSSTSSSATAATATGSSSETSTASGGAGTAGANAERGRGGGRPAVDHPPPRVMAEVMQLYRRTQQRLDSHWERLTTMLTEDPTFENETESREHQRLYQRVTEIMHFLSHAQHAMSDILLNTSQAPPRQLRARPFIIQSVVSSAAVVRNIPIAIPTGGARAAAAAAAARSASASRASARGGASGTQSGSRQPTQVRAASATRAEAAASTAGPEPMETESPASAAAGAAAAGSRQQQQRPRRAAAAAAGHGLHPESASVEVTMEPIVVGIDISPEITIDASRLPHHHHHHQHHEQAQEIHNLLHGIAVQQGQQQAQQQQQQSAAAEASTSSASTATTTTSGGAAGASASAQTSRARVNSQTQPTTSTRTRLSTQVLTAPGGGPHGASIQFGGIPVAVAGVGGPPAGAIPIPVSLAGALGGGGPGISPQPGSNFDVLLPCNSHHIPSNAAAASRSRSRQAAADRQRSASVPPSAAAAANRRDQGTSTGSSQQSSSQRQPGVATFRSVRGSPTAAGPRQPAAPAAVPPFMAPFMNSIFSGMGMGVQRSGEGGGAEMPPPQGMEASMESLLSGLLGGGEAESDPGMANAMFRIIREISSASQGGAGGGERGTPIASLLESFSDYSYTPGEDLVTDLLMCLARTLTINDLIGLLSGSNDVMGRVQEPLQSFMRQRMNLGVEEGGSSGSLRAPSAEAIQEAVLRLLDEAQPSLEATVETANVIEGVDYAETLNEFLNQRLARLVSFIWNSNRQEFARSFYEVCQVFLTDLTNLSVRCFSDGQASLERLARGQLSAVNGGVGSSSIRTWTMSTAIGHLRTYLAGMGEAADAGALESVVVKTEDAAARKTARQKRIEERSLADAGGASKPQATDGAAGASSATAADDNDDAEDETFETPRSSPEAMEVSQEDEEEVESTTEVKMEVKTEEKPIVTENGDKPSSAPSPPASLGAEQFPASLMTRSGMGPDMVVGRDPWHRSVPAEWVPIITRDAQLQAPLLNESSAGRQAPFSDAYLTTVPAKKRRLAASRKPVDGTVRQAIEASLGDAIRITGVQPKTSKEEAAKSASANAKVEKSLEENARGSIKRRLEQDKDFDPQRFPNCNEFLDKQQHQK